MKNYSFKEYKSHGDGSFTNGDFSSIGNNVIFEKNVLVFHPENIRIGSNVYVGHSSLLKGYHRNEMVIGDNVWIGQGCFFHSAGGIYIGNTVGIGPMVKIITSYHDVNHLDGPVMLGDINFKPVKLGDGCDIGVGSTILPGVEIGEGAVVGAGAVVTKNVKPYSIVAGVPAILINQRRTKNDCE